MSKSTGLPNLAPRTAATARLLGRPAALCLAALIALGCSGDRPSRDDRGASRPDGSRTGAVAAAAAGPVAITMRRVHLRMGQGISLDVDRLEGHMVSRRPEQTPVFDDRESYDLHVDRAEVSMTAASVAALLNERVFAQKGASIDDVELKTVGQMLELKGDLNKGIEIPFTLRASVTPGGGTRLRLHPKSLKAVGIPAKDLMHFFGIEIDDLIDTKDSPGIAADENVLVLDAAQALPPPRMRGEITAVRVTGGGIAMTLGAPESTAEASDSPDPRANYIFFRGSDIRFGKLTMHDADLALIDADPSNPFDFSPALYEKQLVAGYSKTQPDGGLETFMPDFARADEITLSPEAGAAGPAPDSAPGR